MLVEIFRNVLVSAIQGPVPALYCPLRFLFRELGRRSFILCVVSIRWIFGCEIEIRCIYCSSIARVFKSLYASTRMTSPFKQPRKKEREREREKRQSVVSHPEESPSVIFLTKLYTSRLPPALDLTTFV